MSEIKKNITYSVLYKFVNIAINLFLTPYVSRSLGAEKYGECTYSVSIAYLFGIFGILGMENYGSRRIAEIRAKGIDLSKDFCEILSLQCILTFVVSLLYLLYFSFLVNYSYRLILVLYILSLSLDISWFFYGIEKVDFIFKRTILFKIICIVCVLLFIKQPDDFKKYLIIISAGQLFSNFLLFLFAFKYTHISFIHFKNIFKHFIPSCILFIPVIGISIYNYIDKIMIGSLSNVSDVAFYSNSEKIMLFPQLFVTSIGAIMMPRITSLISVSNTDKALYYLKETILLVAFISSACTFGILSISKEFVSIYLGKSYLICATLLFYLMPCLIFKAYANVFRTQYLIPYKKDLVYVSSILIGAFLNLFLNFILIPHFKVSGACIATMITEISVCLFQMFYLLRYVHIFKTIIKGFIFQFIGLFMMIVLLFIPSSDSIIVSLSFKVIFGSFLYLLLSFICCILFKINVFQICFHLHIN